MENQRSSQNRSAQPDRQLLLRTTPRPQVVAGLLLLIHAGLLAWIGYKNSPSMDDVAHLSAGLSHWYLGDFTLYKVNPPLARSVAVLPVLVTRPKVDWKSYVRGERARAEFGVGQDFMRINGRDGFRYHVLARWACIPFSLVGGTYCFLWGRAIYSPLSGLFALTLWCFSPNVLGNAAMVTPDAPAAALGLAATYHFYHWLEAPGWANALLAGLVLGLAELTKTTWIILFALWPCIWVAWNLYNRPFSAASAWCSQALNLSVILLFSIYLINLAYGFDGSFRPLKNFEFVSDVLAGNKVHSQTTGNRFREHWTGVIPVPFPACYVEGIDIQRSDFERKKWCYLAGRQQLGGWWYWYLYAMAVKVPLGTWGLFLMAAIATAVQRKHSAIFAAEMVLLAPAVAVFLLISSQTGFTRYLRYALPAFPFLMVWMSRVALAIPLKRAKFAVAAVALLAWTVESSLAVYPFSISYFNELGGGPMGGHACLVDANIDWGQELLRLKSWLARHPEASPLHLGNFGFVDPKIAGIEFRPVPKLRMISPDQKTSLGNIPAGQLPRPGWYALSVNHLRAYRHFGDEEPDYAYFLRFRPVATIGYAIYIYHLDEDGVAILRPNFAVKQPVRD